MVSLTLETEEVDAIWGVKKKEKGQLVASLKYTLRQSAGYLFSEINSDRHWVEKQAASPRCVEVRVHTICFLISEVWHVVAAVSVQRC